MASILALVASPLVAESVPDGERVTPGDTAIAGGVGECQGGMIASKQRKGKKHYFSLHISIYHI